VEDFLATVLPRAADTVGRSGAVIPKPFLCHQKFCFPQKNMFNPLGPGCTPFFAELCNPITRQAIELESYPNHPRIQQVL